MKVYAILPEQDSAYCLHIYDAPDAEGYIASLEISQGIGVSRMEMRNQQDVEDYRATLAPHSCSEEEYQVCKRRARHNQSSFETR